MPLVWRLTPPLFARALDGEGSNHIGGLWNSPGVAMVYTSSHLSLCVLEVLVNFPPFLRIELPKMEAVSIQIPDDARHTYQRRRSRAILSASDPLVACRTAGDRWIWLRQHHVLAAPSVVIPEELNIMLNPAHPRMRDVAIMSARAFRFDPRLAASRA